MVMATQSLITLTNIIALIHAQCNPCLAPEMNCLLAAPQLYTCNITHDHSVNPQQNTGCVEYDSLCETCTVPCALDWDWDDLNADQLFAAWQCKKATHDCFGNAIGQVKQPGSIFIEYIGYFVLLLLVIIWISFKVIRHFACPKHPPITHNDQDNQDIGDRYKLYEESDEDHTEEIASEESDELYEESWESDAQLQARNQMRIKYNLPSPESRQAINFNPQQQYIKSIFELIHGVSDIINCTVFIVYFEYFTRWPVDSYVYTVCCICYGIRIILFLCNIIDNILISFGAMSDNFILNFTITIDMIHYHLSLMDGMFKLVYSFPPSWHMQPSTFWNITFSIAFAALNLIFLPIKYDLKQISVMSDKIIEHYEGSWRDKCCFSLILQSIEYSAKLTVFIPTFIIINTITAGLSVITIWTRTPLYSMWFGFFWIFGLYMHWGFRKIRLNLFADLTIYILVVNLCEVIDVSIMTSTLWLYGHFNGPIIIIWGGSNLIIPDDHYYLYTLSSWILYIALFFALWQIYPLIYELCSGQEPLGGRCCNMTIYVMTYPLALFVGVGLCLFPVFYLFGILSVVGNLIVFVGSLCRIFNRIKLEGNLHVIVYYCAVCWWILHFISCILSCLLFRAVCYD
eukprot:1076009_1